ncbi:MAG: restriction endonuclease [Holophagales bacterium]|jgi:restriction system protein|nr:restriction endonuclease [Holophagales bacterium]
MAIPKITSFVRPILELAAKTDITKRSAMTAMGEYFKLTPEEHEIKTSTGSNLLGVRVSFTISHLKQRNLLERVAPSTYRATELGKQILIDQPGAIKLAGLRKITDKKSQTGEDSDTDNGTDGISDITPIETIDRAVNEINEDLKTKLMDEILRQDPTFFENLVLDVLVKMGYGGSRQEAAEHLGKSNDEGIDGCINQDPLGLDKVVIQAKRYAPDRAINREAIQSFIGAMSGRGVSKGIFITTSYFNANAKEFVQRGSTQKVILIDGNELLELMLKHKVGTRVERTIDIMALDQNYFNEDE